MGFLFIFFVFFYAAVLDVSLFVVGVVFGWLTVPLHSLFLLILLFFGVGLCRVAVECGHKHGSYPAFCWFNSGQPPCFRSVLFLICFVLIGLLFLVFVLYFHFVLFLVFLFFCFIWFFGVVPLWR